MAFENAELNWSDNINIICGENSTGKTTLLKVMYSLVKPLSYNRDTLTKEMEEQLFVKKIQGRAQYYLERGFLPQVVEAFFAEKMEGISKVFTQKDAELFLKPSTPQVQYGDITTPNRPFYSEAEELMLWSETSYRGPLVPAGNKRYQELFQKIMPKEAAFL